MRKRRWGATESTIMTARATPRFHAQCSAVPCHWRSTHAAWRPATPLLSAGADRPPPSTVSGRAVREGLEGFEVGGLFSTIQHPATFQVWIRLGHISPPPTHPSTLQEEFPSVPWRKNMSPQDLEGGGGACIGMGGIALSGSRSALALGAASAGHGHHGPRPPCQAIAGPWETHQSLQGGGGETRVHPHDSNKKTTQDSLHQ